MKYVNVASVYQCWRVAELVEIDALVPHAASDALEKYNVQWAAILIATPDRRKRRVNASLVNWQP